MFVVTRFSFDERLYCLRGWKTVMGGLLGKEWAWMDLEWMRLEFPGKAGAFSKRLASRLGTRIVHLETVSFFKESSIRIQLSWGTRESSPVHRLANKYWH